MKDLVNYLVKQFVDEGSFETIVLEDEKKIDYKVLVDKDQIAKVIGKAGKTSRAIRALVRAASDNNEKSVSFFIAER